MSEISFTDGSKPKELFGSAELACGRSVDEALEQAADGRAADLDQHQADCQHCQAALTEFSTLWAPVTEYAAKPVDVPAEITRRVMDQVRRLVKDVWYTAYVSDSGVVRVASRIVGRIARDAARTVPGVHAVLGRTVHGKMVDLVDRSTRDHRHPHSAVGVLGQTAAIDLAIAVEYGDPVHAVAEEVQARVKQRLHTAINLQDITVNVTVDDILHRT
ncbi:MAG: Asp23/Gls24 family envelope stress response protein [Antricoccus sp.]